MNTNRRQTIKSTIYTYVGVVLGFVTRVFLFPFMLTTGQIGALDLLVKYGMILSQVGTLGFGASVVKYFPYFRDKEKRNSGSFFIIMLVGCVGFVLVGAAVFLLKDWFVAQNAEKSPLFAKYYYYLLPLIFFFAMYTLVDAYARMIYQSSIGAFLKEFAQRIFLLLSTVAVLPLLGFDSFVLAYTLSLCLPTVLLFVFLYRLKEISILPEFTVVRSEHWKPMMRRSFYGLITGIGYLGLLNVDVFMLNSYLGESAVGVYTTAFYFTTMILIPSRSVSRVSTSIVADSMKTEDWGKIKNVYYQTCINQFLISIILFAAIVVNTREIVAVLGKEYHEAWSILLFVGLGSVVEMMTGINHIIVENSRYYRFATLSVVVLIVTSVILNILLIPAYGLTGVAIGTLISTIIFNGMKYLFIVWKFRLQPFNFKFLEAGFISALVITGFYFLPFQGMPYIEAPVKGGAICLVLTVIFCRRRYSPEFNHLVNSALAIIRRK